MKRRHSVKTVLKKKITKQCLSEVVKVKENKSELLIENLDRLVVLSLEGSRLNQPSIMKRTLVLSMKEADQEVNLLVNLDRLDVLLKLLTAHHEDKPMKQSSTNSEPTNPRRKESLNDMHQ